MTRLAVIALTLAVALLTAPSAFGVAMTYTVNDAGDQPDADTTDGLCDWDLGTAGPQCTLRAAIQQADANPGTDTINFSGAGQSPHPLAGFSGTPALGDTSPAAPCCAITEAVTIDGGGATTVTFDQAAAGPLLQSTAADTVIKNIAFTGGLSGPVLTFSGTRAKLDHVTVHDTPGTAIAVSGSSASLGSVTVSHPGGTGISITGSGASLGSPSVSHSGGTGISISNGSATITSPVIASSGGTGIDLTGSGISVQTPNVSGSSGDGISVGGNSDQINGGDVDGNGGNGIFIAGQNDIVNRVVIWANGAKPIALASGANGAILPPQNLRIGPRRADGSLPLTGSTSGGGIEMWSGDPFGPLAPAFADAFSVNGGDFTYNFPSEPQPGQMFALTLTGGSGTSEFATVRVPDDTLSPDILRARALSQTAVLIAPSEPLDPASVQPSDFSLMMAGKPRTITAATASPDGAAVTLTSSGWLPGEAGSVQLVGPGAVTDAAGNANLAATQLRVAAAPGDFVAPLAGNLSLSPRSMCLTHGRGCRVTGLTIKFVTSEAGKAAIVIQRGNKRVGKRIYGNVAAGLNKLKFNGRLGGRKLRAGRYRLLLFVQDAVGNVTDQPPITLFSVRRVSK